MGNGTAKAGILPGGGVYRRIPRPKHGAAGIMEPVAAGGGSGAIICFRKYLPQEVKHFSHPFMLCITTIFRLLPHHDFFIVSSFLSVLIIATICRVLPQRIYHKKRQKVKEANTTTPEFLQDAIAADLADLFEGQTLPSSAGDRRPIRVYSQDLPIIEGMDETEDRTEEIPEPYIIVRTNEGNIPDANSAQEIDLILVVCTYDKNPNRQGHRDVLHIIQEIYGRYAKNPLVRIKADSGGARGGPWSVKYPIKWVTQQEDAHPYYFGAMSLKFEAPAVRQEVPFI